MAIAWQLLVGGVDVAHACDRGFALRQVAFPRTSTLTFRIDDPAGTIDIAEEDDVILSHDGTRVFAGYVRTLGRADAGVTTHRVYEIECQDYTTLLADDVVHGAAGNRTATESDSARIAWLFATFCTTGITLGSHIATLKASMPHQDLRGLSLFRAMEAIASVKGGFFYVDYSDAKELFYGRIRDIAASFGLSDTPDGATTFGYHDFNVPSDSNDLVNRVFIQGDRVSGFVADAGSIALYGKQRTAYLDEPAITTTGARDDRGADYLELHKDAQRTGIIKTFKSGLRAGMTVEVTHQGWGLSAEAIPIAQLDARPVGPTRIEYTLSVGELPRSLVDLIATVKKTADTALHAVGSPGSGGGVPSGGGGGGGAEGSGDATCCMDPWVCVPTEFRVGVGPGGAVDNAVLILNDPTWNGTQFESSLTDGALGGPYPMFTLYGGATYRMTLTVFHSPASGFLNTVGVIQNGGGTNGHTEDMGGPGGGATNRTVDWTVGTTQTDFILFFEAVNSIAYNSYNSTAEISIRYVSGPDPRFVDLPACSNPDPVPGQPIAPTTLTGDGTTTDFTTDWPIQHGSIVVSVDGLDWTNRVIEADLLTGNYSLDYAPAIDSNIRYSYNRGPLP